MLFAPDKCDVPNWNSIIFPIFFVDAVVFVVVDGTVVLDFVLVFCHDRNVQSF